MRAHIHCKYVQGKISRLINLHSPRFGRNSDFNALNYLELRRGVSATAPLMLFMFIAIMVLMFTCQSPGTCHPVGAVFTASYPTPATELNCSAITLIKPMMGILQKHL